MDFSLVGDVWLQSSLCCLQLLVDDAEYTMTIESVPSDLRSKLRDLLLHVESMQIQCQDLTKLTSENEVWDDDYNQVPSLITDLKDVLGKIRLGDIDGRASLDRGIVSRWEQKKPESKNRLPLAQLADGLFDLLKAKSKTFVLTEEQDIERRKIQRKRAQVVLKYARSLFASLTESFELVRSCFADVAHLNQQYNGGLATILDDARLALQKTIRLQKEYHDEASNAVKMEKSKEVERVIDAYRQYAMQLVAWIRKNSRYQEAVLQLLEFYELNSEQIDRLAQDELVRSFQKSTWCTLAMSDCLEIKGPQDLLLPGAATYDEKQDQTLDARIVRKQIVTLSKIRADLTEIANQLTKTTEHQKIIKGNGHIQIIMEKLLNWRKELWSVLYRACATRYYVKRKQLSMTAQLKTVEQRSAHQQAKIAQLREREDAVLGSRHIRISETQAKQNMTIQSEILKILPVHQTMMNECRILQQALHENHKYIGFSNLVACAPADLRSFEQEEKKLQQRAEFVNQCFKNKQQQIDQQVESKLIQQLSLSQSYVTTKFYELEKLRQGHETKIWNKYREHWMKKYNQLIMYEISIQQYHDEVLLITELAPDLSKLYVVVHKVVESFQHYVEKCRTRSQLSMEQLLLDTCVEMLPRMPLDDPPLTTYEQDEETEDRLSPQTIDLPNEEEEDELDVDE